MSTIRPAFAEFAQKTCGTTPAQLAAGVHTLDTTADDEVETALPKVFESYTESAQLMQAAAQSNSDDLERDGLDKMFGAGREHPQADDALDKIMKSVTPAGSPVVVPGKFIAGSDGIFGVELYGMGNPLGDTYLAGHAGTLVVDITPHQDGVHYFIQADPSYVPGFDPQGFIADLFGKG